MVVTFISQKGGSGKSTLAINLALALSTLKGNTVALVDADEQQSCIGVLSRHPRANLKLIQATKEPHLVIQGLKERSIVCDTAGYSHGAAWEAAAVSHLAIIPIQPSLLDVLAANETVQALLAVRDKLNRGLRIRFLINRANPRTTLAKTIRDTLVDTYSIKIMDTVLCDRGAFKQSLHTGQSVIEHDSNSRGAIEMGNLVVEVSKILKSKKKD